MGGASAPIGGFRGIPLWGAGGLTHAACDGVVDAKASDGTIHLQVDKIHPETNQSYMKSGVNVTALTHLSGSGNILNITGVKPT